MDGRSVDTEKEREDAVGRESLPEHVLAVRLGHGANCSSVGSVVDTLFASAVVTGAIFAAICAAMTKEEVTVVGARPGEQPDASKGTAPGDDEREREP